MNIKNNLPLIFGISIPILMIVAVALSIYIPQLFVRPQYDFLYLMGNNNCYGVGNNWIIYSVQGGKLVKSTQRQQPQPCFANEASKEPKIFRYSVGTNQGKEISFADAENLDIDSSQQSPDGFEIVNGGNGGGEFFPFFYSGSDYYSKYISGHNISKKLNIQQNSYNFSFLGWINK